MKVYVAEEAGFCFGVKRALNIIENLHEKGNEVQILGQLIHNRSVLDDLKTKGIRCINTLDQLDPDKTLIIRTHGIPKEAEADLKKKRINYVDATCPLVKKLHQTIEKQDPNTPNTRILIVGDRNHPEIIAAKSYCPGAIVINSQEEANDIEYSDNINVVAQTTLDTDFFERIVSILENKTRKLHVYNTICKATKVRQAAIKKLATKVDVVVVVGGKNSSNTKKLYNIARKRNKNTFHIEKSSDLHDAHFIEKLANFHSVGITAGASTPPEEIEKIEKFLRNFSSNIEEKEMNHGRSERNAGYERGYEC
ncbi:MAG: 4-hydroxy-3-methylbut-2-enyl diphosphate reductase [Candidatus Aminicenantes bacterium]|nr:MAG: 4-hydroxy-3-methylbut-2-enyl diphosphate reductase [Candidatus Aminicenantes bacterium]